MDSITILTTTYYPDNEAGHKRYAKAQECLMSWLYGIKFKGTIRRWVADDGSEFEYYPNSRQERKGIGASLNTGFKACFEWSDVALYIVDDWKLLQEIDINPWVELLENNEHIGMVRIGPPHPGLTGNIDMFPEGFAVVLDRHHYAYSMRPALYHKRFFEAYGWFDEGINCWDCERIYNERFCSMEGPEIVYALPMQWEHIDTLPLGQLEPGGL